MNLKELRLKLTRYTPDVLQAFARARVPTMMPGYPLERDVTVQVQWLIETFERKVLIPELELLANQGSAMARHLLIQGFSEGDIYRFMYDTPEFSDVVKGIGMNKSKMAYINALIEHCDQYPEKWPLLLEWMRSENPSRYTAMFLTW